MFDRAKTVQDLTWSSGDSDFYWNFHIDGRARGGAEIMIYLPGDTSYSFEDCVLASDTPIRSRERLIYYGVEVLIPKDYAEDEAKAFLRLITDRLFPELEATPSTSR
jgi:hypothetical protein